MSGFDLVERDVETGEILRVLVESFSSEASYPSDFTLNGGRTRMYFDEFVEDSWFSCESSTGTVYESDLVGGARTEIGAGVSPALSADGSTLAYLAASRCLPDPENPSFVITPYDSIVVIDLGNANRVEHQLGTPPERWDAPDTLIWVGFDGDGLLLAMTRAGRIHRFPIAGSTDPSASPVVAELPGVRPVEVHAGRLIGEVVGEEGSTDVYGFDMGTSDATLLVSSEYPLRVGVSDAGTPIVGYDPRDAAPVRAVGAEVQLVPIQPADGLSIVLGGIDW